MTDDAQERNKANVQAFYDLAFNQPHPAEATEQYAGDGYIQHSPHVGDGKQAFIEYFEWMAVEYPGKRVEFKRAIAQFFTRRIPTRQARTATRPRYCPVSVEAGG